MRIAIISEGYFPELSGVTTSLYERARHLSLMGHVVRIYAPDYTALASLYPNYRSFVGQVSPGVEVVPFDSKPYYVDYTRDPKPFSFGRIAQDIRGFKPDVIHVECPARLFLGFLSRPGISLAKELGVPITAIYHTNYLAYVEDYKDQIAFFRVPGVDGLLRNIMVWVYNSYDVTMVPTPVTRDYLAEQGVGNTSLGYFYGVESQRFRPNHSAPPEAYKAVQDQVKILYVGRLTPDKQIAVLLQAFDLLCAEAGNCRFIFIGGGPEEALIRSWAGQRGDVLLLGRIPYDEIAPYYAHADIFVSASHKENRPLTVMEAMSSGLPVVAPKAGGLIDLIDHERTGFHAEVGEPHSIASMLSRLVEDSALRQKIGYNASQAVRPQSWENAACEMVVAWEELIYG